MLVSQCFCSEEMMSAQEVITQCLDLIFLNFHSNTYKSLALSRIAAHNPWSMRLTPHNQNTIKMIILFIYLVTPPKLLSTMNAVTLSFDSPVFGSFTWHWNKIKESKVKYNMVKHVYPQLASSYHLIRFMFVSSTKSLLVVRWHRLWSYVSMFLFLSSRATQSYSVLRF